VLALKKFLKRLLPKKAAPPLEEPKKVWRMSEPMPGGEWVDPGASSGAPELGKPVDAESTGSGWFTSSMDLLDGTDIVDRPASQFDTQFDELAAFYPGLRRHGATRSTDKDMHTTDHKT
jgi:hypothetical protein